MSFSETASCEIGEVRNVSCEMKAIEWKIADFVSVTQDEKFESFVMPSFTFANVRYAIELWPNWKNEEEFIFVSFKRYGEFKFPVEYCLGLKTVDGFIENLPSRNTKMDTQLNVYSLNFIEKGDLLQRRTELMPCNVLTVTCTLKLMTDFRHSTEAAVMEKMPPVLIGLDKLSENLKNLLSDEDTCDTTLKVKDKEYQAHRSVLIARSSVFAANFKHDTLERQTGLITITDCDPESFQDFLEYLYSGKLENISYDTALSLYYTSDKYDVQELKTFCTNYLKQCLTVENMSEIAIFADKYDETQLVSLIQDFFNRNFRKVLETTQWESLLMKDYRLANRLLKEMSKTV